MSDCTCTGRALMSGRRDCPACTGTKEVTLIAEGGGPAVHRYEVTDEEPAGDKDGLRVTPEAWAGRASGYASPGPAPDAVPEGQEPPAVQTIYEAVEKS